jgi:hypothetical protein
MPGTAPVAGSFNAVQNGYNRVPDCVGGVSAEEQGDRLRRLRIYYQRS